jgi:hypothetical protein
MNLKSNFTDLLTEHLRGNKIELSLFRTCDYGRGMDLINCIYW